MRKLVLVVALAMAACVDPTEPAGTPAVVLAEEGEEFVLAIGGEARVDGALVLELVGVPEDSRCPTDVQCPWQGNATLLLRATVEGDVREVRLDTNDGREAAIEGWLIILVALDPAPLSTAPIDEEAYRATLRVERPGEA